MKDTLESLFQNKELLDQALTHRSWVNENRNVRNHNERLEFLGDAVLEFIVSKELFKKFPEKEEGYLTALRANLVNTANLARVAKNLGLGEKIYLSHGEEESGGRKNPSLLADTLEAVIGALFLDSGIEATNRFIKKMLLSEVAEKIKRPLKDFKSRLQEHVQAKGLPTPKYQVVEEVGPDHAKEFVVKVKVDGKSLGVGRGKSKNEASQKAAEAALKRIKEKEVVNEEKKR